MDTLDKIYDMIYCELDDISKKGKLDIKDVELIDKFVDIIKDIDDIGMTSDAGYSQMRGRNARMGSSYGRGRSMSRGYSRNESKDMMLDRLQDIADMAVDEKDRKAVERLMQQMSEN